MQTVDTTHMVPVGGGRVMTFLEFIKSRRKKAVLFFLAGFFSGGILYYLCQEPAGEALAALEENMVLWAAEEKEFFQVFLFILWERMKVFAVLWLAGYTKIYKAYIGAFLIYTGIQSGFLLTFFIMVRGSRGILYWLASGFPHLLLLAPLYVYSFYRFYERKREKQMPAILFIVICFITACFLEAKFNVPLIQWLYKE